jgi:hypothetical protein
MSAVIAFMVQSPSCLPTSSIFFMSVPAGGSFGMSFAQAAMSVWTFSAQALSFLSAHLHIASLNSTILDMAAPPPSAFFLQPANERRERVATNAIERFFI